MAEMLSGQTIVYGESIADVVAKQLSAEPVPLPPMVLQSSLGAVIHRATRKDAAHRYGSAAEMLEAIAPASTQGTQPAPGASGMGLSNIAVVLVLVALLAIIGGG